MDPRYCPSSFLCITSRLSYPTVFHSSVLFKSLTRPSSIHSQTMSLNTSHKNKQYSLCTKSFDFLFLHLHTYMHICHPSVCPPIFLEESGFLNDLVLSVIPFVNYFFKLQNSFLASSYREQVFSILKKKSVNQSVPFSICFLLLSFLCLLKARFVKFLAFVTSTSLQDIRCLCPSPENSPNKLTSDFCVSKYNGFFSGLFLLNRPVLKYSLAFASFESSCFQFSFCVYHSLFQSLFQAYFCPFSFSRANFPSL